MPDRVRDIDRTDEVIRTVDVSLPEFLETVYQRALRQIVSNMASGRDAMGRSWAALDPATVAAKGHSTPLVDSGDLMDNIEEASEFDAKSNAAIFSSSLPYAGVHEFGMAERNIPPRPFLQPGLQYAAEISDEVWQDEVDNAIQSELL